MSTKTPKLGLYALLHRLWRGSSYTTKLLVVAVVGMHTMLGSAFLLVLEPTLSKPAIYFVATAERILAISFSVWLLWSLLAPLRATVRFLEEYIESGKITDLPTHFPDEAGRLMANTHLVVTQLDRSVSDLAKSSSTDVLTGLPNRRFGMERLGLDIEQAKLQNSPAVLAIIDLDDLKAINDTKGHQAGDEYIRRMGHALQAVLAPGDWVARWGGDEYIAVFWQGDAELRLELTRAALLESGVSFSVGLANLSGDPEAALERADMALYRAKAYSKGQHGAVTRPRQSSGETLREAM